MRLFKRHLGNTFFLWLLVMLFSCSESEPDPRLEEFKRLGREGNYEASNEIGRELIQRDGKNGRVAFIMSDNFLEMGLEDSGLHYLDLTIDFEPEWPGPHNNKGLVFQENDEHEKAIEAFDKAIEVDPDFPYSYNNRGYSKILLGQFRDGMKDVLKSEELDADNAYVYRNKALYYEKTGKATNACKWLQKAYDKKFYDQIENQLSFIEMRVCN
ncbi:MAG: tetratricopeptide repeat protein [Bacteroidia bacterium]|nr:tetratricopeptide repeat protein [Bacteroidia bacterium]